MRLGFGLHVGWAIEGAIGSEYKIDASYLSPNVNMASRLEAATKQYGVSILLSEDFVCMLSASVRERVRQARPGSACMSQGLRAGWRVGPAQQGHCVHAVCQHAAARTPAGPPYWLWHCIAGLCQPACAHPDTGPCGRLGIEFAPWASMLKCILE